MKKLLTLAAAALALAGCASVRHYHRNTNPYERTLFYQKYLNPQTNPLDANIERTLAALRAQPRSARLHNELGQYLVEKGFPKDAEVEFERSVNADKRFYPAWYNLGLIRDANGDDSGARFAFGRAVHYKPGHAAALFQLGLLQEKANNPSEAIGYYAKAFTINPSLLDVRVNPRVLDSNLTHLALIKAYATEHAHESMTFQPAPARYTQRGVDAVSPQPAAKDIVTPVAPVTDPSRQTPPPPPGARPLPQPQPATPPAQPPSSTVVPPGGH